MATKTTTLSKVGAFDGVNKNGKPYVRSVFKDAEGVEWTTFKGEIASQAEALLGQPVELEVEETQNGQYVNRNLVSVKAHQNGNTPATVATPDVAQVTQAEYVPPAVTTGPSAKDRQIAKAVALKLSQEAFVSQG